MAPLAITMSFTEEDWRLAVAPNVPRFGEQNQPRVRIRMPTNLPDPRKQKPDESRDTLLTVLFGVVRLAVILAVAIIIWSFIANR